MLWYDSVVAQGHLTWQNELNDENRMFFDAASGIFLNYHWTEKHLVRTRNASGTRKHDVFVGVDVWGRGSFGGGQMHCYRALSAVQQQGGHCACMHAR